MKPCTLKDSTESLKRFRQQLYDGFPARRDASLNLLDSLCANTLADSVVELSLNAPFERGYSRITDAIDNFAIGTDGPERTAFARIAAEPIPPPSRARPFRLFGVDSTPNPRPFAATLADRGVIYPPNPAPGNKPIAVGHADSVVAALPERSPPRRPVDRSPGLPAHTDRQESNRSGRRTDRRLARRWRAARWRGVERTSGRLPLQPRGVSPCERRIPQPCRACTQCEQPRVPPVTERWRRDRTRARSSEVVWRSVPARRPRYPGRSVAERRTAGSHQERTRDPYRASALERPLAARASRLPHARPPLRFGSLYPLRCRDGASALQAPPCGC